jgi:hypothetical protein
LTKDKTLEKHQGSADLSYTSHGGYYEARKRAPRSGVVFSVASLEFGGPIRRLPEAAWLIIFQSTSSEHKCLIRHVGRRERLKTLPENALDF